MQQGILYRVKCKLCLQEGKNSFYIGESARTPYDRGLEHLNLINREDRESPCVEHRDEYHQGQEVEFQMAVLSYPKTTLQRQATEAFQMDLHREVKNCLVINRRGEWGQNLPPKMVMDENGHVSKQSKRRGNSNQEGVAKRRKVEEINLQQNVKFDREEPGQNLSAQSQVEGAECPSKEDQRDRDIDKHIQCRILYCVRENVQIL